MDLRDSIAAIATPLGEGGLSVIRVSGRNALDIGDRIFRSAAKPPVAPSIAQSHTVHYGHVVENGVKLDEVLLTVFRAPKSFTREDVVEISCHGGILITKLILEAIVRAGARPAGPGEFSRRAFLNGRLDLSQAEAIADLIRARTELAVQVAQEQLSGSISRSVESLRTGIIASLAHIEAHIDFPDEDISPDTREALLANLSGVKNKISALLSTAFQGQVLRNGIRATLIGSPNAGKSSLLNLLLGRERAIVSPIPGTTRDTVEEMANINGIPVIFVDTAGVRTASDSIEAEGVRRSQEAAGRADLILHVIDGSRPLAPEDLALLEQFSGRPRILVINKSDLSASARLPEGVPVQRISCLTQNGLDALRESIHCRILGGGVVAEHTQVAINTRHANALRRALETVQRSISALEDILGHEIVAFELRVALGAIGEIGGITTTDDLLDSIFSQFCIGK
jgi:tRNA modification GTPase